MSIEKFDDNCPGCRPVILDIVTHKPLPESDPAMQKMLAIWARSSYEQREAFHNVMCNNSRDAYELALVKELVDQLK